MKPASQPPGHPPAQGARVRVVIADDSLFMRAAVRKILERDGRFEIVGEARDGADAIAKVAALRPDVCTMDFNMPGMNGAQAVAQIMRERPTPIVMFSAYTKEGARETFEALAAGAVDFVTKPSGEVSADLSGIAADLVERLLAARGVRAQLLMAMPAVLPPTSAATSAPVRISATRMAVAGGGPRRVVIVASSTGGPAALAHLLPALPRDTSVALVVVQHLPANFTGPLAERLNALSAISVREAQPGDVLSAGLALIAPGGQHLEFAVDGSVRIVAGPEVNGVRPSADVTMRSAASVFAARALGVVLTGMGRDGAEGIRAIKASGGATLAQDESSSVIYGMPRAAVETGCVDRSLPLASLADAIRHG